MEQKEKRVRHAAIGTEQNDCFNVLPDEILVVILSSLEVKEAVRTSLLCHRWRNLWKSSGSLDFDSKDAMLRLAHNDNKTGPDEALKYIDLVNRVLETHEGSTVEQLRIVFDMQGCGYFVRSSIDKWVDFAIVKRVQRLELDLNSLYGSLKSFCTYPFPSWLLDIPLDLPSFDRLTALCLKSVCVSDAVMEYFLSTCLFLEQLTVERAHYLQNYIMDRSLMRGAPPVPEESGGFKHQCLKVIEFVGWVGHKIDVQCAIYLIERAVSLEKIIFDLRIPNFGNPSWMGEFNAIQGDRETALLSATQFEGKLPPGAKLIIL